MTTTLTITDLLRACDEPDVDRYLVLSQLADAYADAGDVLRSDAARWLAERGKWPTQFRKMGLCDWCLPFSRVTTSITPSVWWWKTDAGRAISMSIHNAIDAYAELGGRIE